MIKEEIANDLNYVKSIEDFEINMVNTDNFENPTELDNFENQRDTENMENIENLDKETESVAVTETSKF